MTRRCCLTVLAAAGTCAGARSDLAGKWRAIAAESDGTVGAAAMHLASGEGFSLNGDERFPLASVCKMPLAMNILALVDEGKLSTSDRIEVLPGDVWHGVSDIAPRWPKERKFAVEELVRLMVARSDNTAEETLYRVGGGSLAMTARFRAWNVEKFRIDRSELECSLDRNGVTGYPPPSQWTEALIAGLIAKKTPDERYRAMVASLSDPRDTATPNATVDLMAKLFRGQALSKASTARLVEIMKSTTTFPTRIKGLLPSGTVVAHKTGLAGTESGFTAATNDSGVIFLPRGAEVAVSVYLKGSRRDGAARDRIIARVARAAYDHWAQE